MGNLKDKKIFGVFNSIDVIIIVLVVLLSLVMYFKLSANEENLFSTIPVRYSVEFTLKSEDYINNIKVGDEIRDSIKGDYLGKVINVGKVQSYKEVENTQEGKFVKAAVPDNYDAIITIEAEGRVTDTSIYAEGTEIKVGQKMFLKGKGYASQCFIIGIDY